MYIQSVNKRYSAITYLRAHNENKISFYFRRLWPELLFFHTGSSNKKENKSNSLLPVLMIEIQIYYLHMWSWQSYTEGVSPYWITFLGQLFIWSKYKKMPLLTLISYVCWPQLLFYIQTFSMYQHVWLLISLSLCMYFRSRSKGNWELSFNLQCRTFQVRILVCSTCISHLFVGDSISLLAQLTSHTHTNHWRWEQNTGFENPEQS